MTDSENLNSIADIEEWVHETERWHALTRDALREAYADDGAAAEEFYSAATGGIFAQWGQSEGEEFGNRRRATDRGIRTLTSLKDRLEFAEEASDAAEQTERRSTKDPRRVMVVHGRNAAAQRAIFMFLRALRLAPIEWEEAIAATGTASPHNLTAVRAAMDVAQAVIVVLTAEDQAGLLPELADEGSAEVLLEGQPRQNVMLEAGMAMGIDPTHTILVQIGRIRGASDFDGLNSVRLTNDPKTRAALRTRLTNADCAVVDSGTDWLDPTAAGDFDVGVIRWEPQTHALPPNDVIAIPKVEMRGGQRVELSLRCFRLPAEATVSCVVTTPDGARFVAHALGSSAGGHQRLFSLVFPEDFDGPPIMAGHHPVSWRAATKDGEDNELAVDEFRFG